MFDWEEPDDPVLKFPLPAPAEKVVGSAADVLPPHVCVAFDSRDKVWCAYVACGTHLFMFTIASETGQDQDSLLKPSLVRCPSILGPLTPSKSGNKLQVVTKCGMNQVICLDMRTEVMELADVVHEVIAILGTTCLTEEGWVKPWAGSGGWAGAGEAYDDLDDEEWEEE